jgi:hypothetical protein
MSRFCAFLLALLPNILPAQGTPEECYRFAFSAWDPPLKSVASTYNPGYDPTSSAPAGTPRDWAAKLSNGKATNTPADSVLLLFPAWWPAGVSIEWKEQRGDTLVGRAVALVADGRVKNPVSAVRAMFVPCKRPENPPRDTSGARGS